MSRTQWASFGLSAGTFLVVLLAFEVALRLAGYDPLGARTAGGDWPVRISDNPALRYELTPNTESHSWLTDVKTNAAGLRDREYPRSKGDRYRIVVIGDSITFGVRLAFEDVFSEVLEAHLNRRLDDRVDVINLGVPGYDVVQEVAQLEQRGLAYEPDIVILALCANDIGDASVTLDYIESLQRMRSPIHRLRIFQFTKVQLDRIRATWELASGSNEREFAETRRAYIRPLDGDPELAAKMSSIEGISHGERLWGLIRVPTGHLAWWSSDAHVGMLDFAFARLAELRSERGFDALVVIVPRLEADSDWDKAYEVAAHVARRNQLAVVNLAPGMARADMRSLRDAEGDLFHPNARGHAIIASEIEAQLLRTGLEAKVRARAQADETPDRLGDASGDRDGAPSLQPAGELRP